MLGVVFTEFVDMVEAAFSEEVADQLLENPKLSTQGVYTSVGQYTHLDIIHMVVQLSEITGVEVDTLVQTFGKHLFSRFVVRYPSFFETIDDPLDFLEGIETHIHTQVRSLYPQAQLPTFGEERVSPDHLILWYTSTRPFSQLALGLIQGASEHFGVPLEVKMEQLEAEVGHKTRFEILAHRSNV